MNKPMTEAEKAELDALLKEGKENGEGEAAAPKDEAEAQDALSSIADSLQSMAANLELIQRHQMALVYMQRTLHPEVTQIGFDPNFFNAIYNDEENPMELFDQALAITKKLNDEQKTGA